MCALPAVGHEHHAALLPHVDALNDLAGELDSPGVANFHVRLAAEHGFIVGQLVPHMERAEATLYPELERLMQNRHSMTPMRHEHAVLRRLITELGASRGHITGFGAQLRLRRLLFRMYALIKIHLGEEEAYIDILRRNLSPAEAAEVARGLAHATAD